MRCLLYSSRFSGLNQTDMREIKEEKNIHLIVLVRLLSINKYG